MIDRFEQVIDAPVSPYSSEEEIGVWIKELESREQTDSVKAALSEARNWLAAIAEMK